MRMRGGRWLVLLLALATSSACTTTRRAARDTIQETLRPWPEKDGPLLIAVRSIGANVATAYDNALVSLVLLRRGRHEDAGRVLRAMAALQLPDGGAPFSFSLPRPDGEQPYVRAGAVAWLGYAAAVYLDAVSGGDDREQIVAMTHRLAEYLIAHQVDVVDDPRNGLIAGGDGAYRYDARERKLREEYVPGPVDWVSTEHNIDSFFFFSALARLTGETHYEEVAKRIRHNLSTHAWSEESGQFWQGLSSTGDDGALALDCASWGSLFLRAAGDSTRATRAFHTADVRYASRDPDTGVRGHKPYLARPVYTNRAVATLYANVVPSNSWDQVDAVWPEGSAGVALAAWRSGARERANEILDALDLLRDDRTYPTLSREVPLEFDTEPSVAGAAWVELVRWEMARDQSAQVLWSVPPALKDPVR